MEPSDGGGWCECDACATLGSVSDRVIMLANQVAKVVWAEFPGTYVGLLAYNEHSPPPTIKVDPHVIVKIQTSFIRGGLSVTELMEGWKARGARIGVGEYYSVFLWDHSRPASAKGSDLAYLQKAIPRFYRQGARFTMCESSDLWGAIGLGHYLAERMMWDIDEAENMEALIQDFLTRAFGPASEPMEAFFRRIYRFTEADQRPLIRTDMVARLYRDLAAARQLAANEPDVLARIDDLLLYTRYEDLYQRYDAASGAERQTAIERLLRHTWRMRKTMMVHAKPVTMHLASRDRSVVQPAKETFEDETPFSEEEKQAILADGIASYEPVEVGFTPVQFSDDLVPATPLKLPHVPTGNYNATAPMGKQVFYTWRNESDPAYFDLLVSGGHIAHYRNIASPVQVRLFAYANPILDEEIAYDDHVKPDGIEETVRLPTTFPGLHRIEVTPPSNRAMVKVADNGPPLTLPASLDHYNSLVAIWSLYFYVPKGTTVVGGYSSGGSRGLVRDSAGAIRCDFSKLPKQTYFAIDVPAGQDGTLWKFEGCNGRGTLLNVPPWMATNAENLLLPREVVERDSRDGAQQSAQ